MALVLNDVADPLYTNLTIITVQVHHQRERERELLQMSLKRIVSPV